MTVSHARAGFFRMLENCRGSYVRANATPSYHRTSHHMTPETYICGECKFITTCRDMHHAKHKAAESTLSRHRCGLNVRKRMLCLRFCLKSLIFLVLLLTSFNPSTLNFNEQQYYTKPCLLFRSLISPLLPFPFALPSSL